MFPTRFWLVILDNFASFNLWVADAFNMLQSTNVLFGKKLILLLL